MITDGLKICFAIKSSNAYQDYIARNLATADIMINGSRPWDIQVHDQSFYTYLFKRGSLALGETYMYGLWDCEELDEFMFRIMRADLENKVANDIRALGYFMTSKFSNTGSVTRVYQVAKKHYDLGNDLFEAMLDKRMNYSCAYWGNASSLEEAQEKKLELICRKLKLEPGQRVLDIGCGWGAFACYAAEKYKVEVVGVTISQSQAKFAVANLADLSVKIKLQDYRSINEGKFDRVVSIGMFEHVGYKNYSDFMKVVNRVIEQKGLFLLHTIGGNTSVTMIDPWINTYIFPNAMIPSVAQIGKSLENIFIMEDWHNFGLHYDRTLMEWLKRFKNAWPELRQKYDEQFYRMWVYYLSCSAASFRSKKNNLWQLVLSPPSDLMEYQSIRQLE